MTSRISLTAGKILAIDTSGTSGSMALGLAHTAWDKKAVHSELATVKLQELLDQANLQLRELEGLMVNVGPGSFTGIRVGLNLARTLSYALNIPICPLNSLELLTLQNAPDAKSAFTAIKAIQNFYYAAGFDHREGGLAQRLAPLSVEGERLPALSGEFEKVLIEGQTPGFSSELDARTQLDWLAKWPDSTTFLTWKEVRPVYIRASEAEEKLLKGLLKA